MHRKIDRREPYRTRVFSHISSRVPVIFANFRNLSDHTQMQSIAIRTAPNINLHHKDDRSESETDLTHLTH